MSILLPTSLIHSVHNFKESYNRCIYLIGSKIESTISNFASTMSEGPVPLHLIASNDLD